MIIGIITRNLHQHSGVAPNAAGHQAPMKVNVKLKELLIVHRRVNQGDPRISRPRLSNTSPEHACTVEERGLTSGMAVPDPW